MSSAHNLPSVHEALAERNIAPAGPDLLIALDIDGTVLGHDGSLSPRVAQALHAHIDAGTRVTLSTGRGVPGTQIVLDQLQLDHGYAVCSNGAVTISLGDTRSDADTKPLPDFMNYSDIPARLVRVHTFDASHEIAVLSKHLPNAFYALESITHRTRINMPFPVGELSGATEIVPLHQMSVPEATRLTLRAPEMTGVELLDIVNGLGLRGVEYAVGWSAWMDFTPSGTSKASGLRDVCNDLGIDATNTVAVGDSGNDCEMLAWAGLGVVMGNSHEYVRQHADAITADVANDGCALILEALL